MSEKYPTSLPDDREKQSDQHIVVDQSNVLFWPRFFAGLAIGWERLWPLLQPVLLVVAGFLIVSWFELWRMVPDFVRIGLVAFSGFLALVSLMSLRRFRMPGRPDIDQRIERYSNLAHHPLVAQSDKLASGTENIFSEVLWREHRSRMGEKLKGLRAGTPNPAMAERDPYGLRSVVVLLLFIGFGYANGEHIGRIKSAFSAQFSAIDTLARLDVWVSPPAYTNRAPLFLSRMSKGENKLSFARVPEGSLLVVRVANRKSLGLNYVTADGTINLDSVASDALDTGKDSKKAATREYRFVLETSGEAQLLVEDQVIGHWQFDIITDHAPKIRFTSKPQRGRGRMLDLAYEFEDDYGVVSAIGQIEPIVETAKTEQPKARPLVKSPVIPLSLSRTRAKVGKAKLSRDLSQHPFAGARVNITLIAKDGAGQVGKSATKEIVLPARYFTKPLAAALVEQRRILAMDANNAPQVADMLDIIANTAPEEFIADKGIYIALEVIWRVISRARNDDQLRDGLDLLWSLALAIEDGDLSEAASRLREAQKALKEALENGASEEEIAALMKDLRAAMSEYLKELTQQMARDNSNQNLPMDQNSQTIRKQDLDRMMDRIENLAKSGSRDAARQLLSEMQQLMDQLQAGQHQQQRQQEGDEFNRQMNKLSKMMQQQQKLMDKTFRMQQQQRDRGQNPQSSNRQGQRNPNSQRQSQQNRQGQMSKEQFREAMKQLQSQQGQLQRQLQDMMKKLQQQGLDPGHELGKAGKSMGKARDALGQGNNGEALGQQGQALKSLRDGARALMRQMQQNMAGQRGGTDRNGQQRNSQAGNDPLGRQQRSRGSSLNSNVKIPGEINAQKAREILDAIRKKMANPKIPRLELNYLDRLLKRQ